MDGPATPLVPPAVEGRGAPHGWLHVAFGRRFFLLVGVGLVWAIPAFANPRLGYAMLAWDVLVLAAWAADLVVLRRASPITVRRALRAPAALSVESTVELTLDNGSSVPVSATIVDAVPAALREVPPSVHLRAGAGTAASATYTNPAGCSRRGGDGRCVPALSRAARHRRTVAASAARADAACLPEPRGRQARHDVPDQEPPESPSRGATHAGPELAANSTACASTARATSSATSAGRPLPGAASW